VDYPNNSEDYVHRIGKFLNIIMFAFNANIFFFQVELVEQAQLVPL